jgi:hypothetical protein
MSRAASSGRVAAMAVAAAGLFVLGSVTRPFGADSVRVDSPPPAASPQYIVTPKGVDPVASYDEIRIYGIHGPVHVKHCPDPDPRHRHGDCTDPYRATVRHHDATWELWYHGHIVQSGG